MGNKKTKKRQKSAGFHNKTKSKGTGHTNPNQIQIADWLIS